MAKARNRVIAGDYENKTVVGSDPAVIWIKWRQEVILDKNNVEKFELMTEDHVKSAASGIARGLIGGALLGPVGMLAGGMSAKNKGIYVVAVQFKDGKKSLMEVDDLVYKNIMRHCF